jgi:hypothetical protein
MFLSAMSQSLSTSAIAAFTGMAYGLGMQVLLNIGGSGMNQACSLGSVIFDDTFIDDLGDNLGDDLGDNLARTFGSAAHCGSAKTDRRE